MIAAVLLDAAPYISALVRHDKPGDTRAKLRFFKGLLHCHGIGLLHRHQCDQNQVFPLQATPGIGQLAQANSDHRETLHRAKRCVAKASSGASSLLLGSDAISSRDRWIDPARAV